MTGASWSSTKGALFAAGATALLALGLPVAAGFPGRFLTIRLFLVAALAFIALAWASASHRRQQQFVFGALVMFGTTIALILRNASTQGLVVLLVGFGALFWARKQLASS